MNRPKVFRPICSELKHRIVLSKASLAAMPTLAILEVRSAKSTALNLNGVSPYGFPAHRGEPVGSPISYIGLGGRSQRLTANGVKVPNSASNRVVPVQWYVVAKRGDTNVQFYGPATLNLTTRKRKLDA